MSKALSTYHKTWEWKPRLESLRHEALDIGLDGVSRLISSYAEYIPFSVDRSERAQMREYFSGHTAVIGLKALIALRLNLDVTHFNKATVKILRDWLMRNYSPKTVATWLSHLKGFFRYQHLQGRVRDNPVVGVSYPKYYRPRLQVAKPQELIELADSALGLHRDGLVTAMLLSLLANTGCRRLELWQLRVSSVVLDDEVLGPHLAIVGKRNKLRQVPLKAKFARQLGLYIEALRLDPTDFLLHESGRPAFPMRGNRFDKHFARLRRKQPSLVHFSYLASRRGFATYLYSRGMNTSYIQALYDHENLRITLGYIAREEVVQLKNLRKYHPAFSSKSF